MSVLLRLRPRPAASSALGRGININININRPRPLLRPTAATVVRLLSTFPPTGSGSSGGGPPPSSGDAAADNHRLYMEQMSELQAERELLFSEDEVDAWSGSSSVEVNDVGEGSMSSSDLDGVNRILAGRASAASSSDDTSPPLPQLDPPPPASAGPGLSHVSATDQSFTMVDPSHKPSTARYATAAATLHLPPVVSDLLTSSNYTTAKGSVLSVARLAGIMGAKKTPDLIPLCHTVPLSSVDVDITHPEPDRLEITCTARTTYTTGVEMEALVGASVAGMTVYDMVKGLSHEVVMGGVKVLEKGGGRRTVRGGKNV